MFEMFRVYAWLSTFILVEHYHHIRNLNHGWALLFSHVTLIGLSDKSTSLPPGDSTHVLLEVLGISPESHASECAENEKDIRGLIFLLGRQYICGRYSMTIFLG